MPGGDRGRQSDELGVRPGERHRGRGRSPRRGARPARRRVPIATQGADRDGVLISHPALMELGRRQRGRACSGGAVPNRPGTNRSPRRRPGRRRRSNARGGRAGQARSPVARRTLPDLGVVRTPPDHEPRTRIVAPAKSTSRQCSASSSPRRRPVNAAVRKIAPSSSSAAVRTSARTSSGEKTWMSPLERIGASRRARAGWRRRPTPSVPGGRCRAAKSGACSSTGSRGRRASGALLDVLRRDRLERAVAERGQRPGRSTLRGVHACVSVAQRKPVTSGRGASGLAGSSPCGSSSL